MCQYPKLTGINPLPRDLFHSLHFSYLTQANLLSPLPRHRSINLFLLAYQRIWIETEEYSFEEKLVQDLAVSTPPAPQASSCQYPCTAGSWASLVLHFSTFVGGKKKVWNTPLCWLSVIHAVGFNKTHFGKHDIIADVRASGLAAVSHPHR